MKTGAKAVFKAKKKKKKGFLAVVQLGEYDTVLYIKKYVFELHPSFWHRGPNPK